MSFFSSSAPEPPADLTPKPVPRVRRPGAPRGNTNAFKHGFYSSRFRASETAALLTLPEGLSEEIALLRVCIRRVFDLVGQTTSADEGIRLLSTLGRAISILDRLLRTQKDTFSARGVEHNNVRPDKQIYRPRRDTTEWYIDYLQSRLDEALNPPAENSPSFGDPVAIRSVKKIRRRRSSKHKTPGSTPSSSGGEAAVETQPELPLPEPP
jgi:hypothetical protein